jgi:hypothetical protein
MATVNLLEHEFNKKEDKMHFTWSLAEWQHLALSNSTLKDFMKLLSGVTSSLSEEFGIFPSLSNVVYIHNMYILSYYWQK